MTARHHDATRSIRFPPLGFAFWHCLEDGGWALGLLGCSIARLHRGDFLEWRVGPFVKRLGGEISFCKVVFVPAWLRPHSEAQRRYLSERST